jgi:hypothetical protein
MIKLDQSFHGLLLRLGGTNPAWFFSHTLEFITQREYFFANISKRIISPPLKRAGYTLNFPL